ncbi:hypothetical protein [Fimbriiglobus ruber]|uniref:Uncharacterized protein n=1 Tax=Fimbriiglobus ruber TaxID=1908690 RepID=A0A225DSY3_9BACT|nr:hypothetical protein [Fimbriiglobus ruber]OWK39485.1 hypothetical protein FRUB_06048 [Fimbriiglobus ruber]
MAKKKAAAKGHQIHDPSPEGLEAAQATAAGSQFVWHSGRVTGIGSYADDGRGVTITWEEGGATSHVGHINDSEWEVFKLAFLAGGRVAILSDLPDWEWVYDYRYLEALR